MPLAVAQGRKLQNVIEIECCPLWVNSACTCPKDAQGAPMPKHHVWQWAPTPGNAMLMSDYVKQITTESLRLSAGSALVPPAPTDLGITGQSS